MRFLALLAAQTAGLCLVVLGVHLLWGAGIAAIVGGVMLCAIATASEINGPPAPPPWARRSKVDA